MKKKTTGFQKTAIGLLAGLILMSLLLIMPVSAVAGEIVAWGYDYGGLCSNAPTGNDYVQVSAGYWHSLALTSDGSIVAWGDYYGNVPTETGFTQVSAGINPDMSLPGHSLALTSDGSIVAWGSNSGNVPTGTGFTQVSAGEFHSLALTSDGSIVAWGDDWDGQCSNAPPGSGFRQVSAGAYHSLALRSDGSIVAWGNDFQCRDAPPGSGFTQVSAGCWHSLALTSDGSIVAWGDDNQCRDAPPGSGFTQVSAGGRHSLALREDGSIVAWGYDGSGRCSDAPPGSGFTQVSAGGQHSLAIKAVTPAPVASISADSSCDEGSEINFDASGSSNTVAGTTYVWTFGDGTGGSGVNALHPYEQDGEYAVTLTVTNPDGQTDTATASITVANAAPTIDSFTMPGTVSVGVTVNALAHFSDPGTDDMHAATLNWGDLTGDDAGCTLSEDTGNVSGAHAYTASGEYQVTLTVTDTDGGSATRSTMITVTEIQTPEPTITPTPEPTDPTPAPEFPTIAVPSILIVGLAGVLLLARRRE